MTSGDGASGASNATPRRGKLPCPTCGEPKRRRRPTRGRAEDDVYRALLTRLLKVYRRRIEESGLPALADVVALRDILDTVIDTGVGTCRSERFEASWSEIGEATGLTRSAAHERWGSLGGARKPGGQPSRLR